MARCPKCRSKVDPEFSTHCPDCGASLHAEIDDLIDERAQPPKPAPLPTRPQTGIPSERSTTVLAGVILIAVSIVAVGARLISNADPGLFTPVESPFEYEWHSSFDMQVGDCLDVDVNLVEHPEGAQLVTYLDRQECAIPHDHEVFAILQFPAKHNEPYPEQDTLIEWSWNACDNAFEPYTGIPLGPDLDLTSRHYHPTSKTWAEGGRDVYCLLYGADPDGADPFPKLVGSKKAVTD